MNLPKVFYLHKHDNLPCYSAGKELHTVEYHRGWVEYLLDTCDIYFQPGLTKKQYQNFLSTVTVSIKDYYHNKDYRIMSFLKQLALERMEHPFSLPLFADVRHGSIITCGSSRFAACVLNGIDPSDIPMVFQTNKNNAKPSELAQYINSTNQLHSLSGIEKFDFILDFSRTSQPTVTSSVLRNTVHESDPNRDTFKEHGEFIFKFWENFTCNGLIDLTISCNDTTRKLIKFDPEIWNITWRQLDHNGFGFGEILEKFAEKKTSGLNLYVYNISGPLHLEYLLPWGDSNSVWFHTLNKQVHLFETTRGAATACWPIKVMGNFVK